jgi:hypothetical protein
MFDFLKKKEVPDVGREGDEDASDEQLIGSGEDEEKKVEEPAVSQVKKGEDVLEKSEHKVEKVEDKSEALSDDVSGSTIETNVLSGSTDLKFEKLDGNIEILNSLMKEINKNLSGVGQKVGEVRNMNLENEKSIIESTKDASKAVDIVKEVKPEKLRESYEEMNLKIQTLNEKLESNHEFGSNLLSEIKELKGKAGLFVGSEGVLKLNDDVKNDLIELQRMASRVRLNADKSEQIFMEVKKGFSESRKLKKVFNNLGSTYSGLQKEVEKLKVNFSSFFSNDDFVENQKRLDNNFAILEDSLSNLDSAVKNNERLTAVIEKVFVLTRNNEKDITNIVSSIKSAKSKKNSDYEERFRLLLGVVDKMGDELNRAKKKAGIKGGGGLGKKMLEIEKHFEKPDVVEEEADVAEERVVDVVKEKGEGEKSLLGRLFGSKKKSSEPVSVPVVENSVIENIEEEPVVENIERKRKKKINMIKEREKDNFKMKELRMKEKTELKKEKLRERMEIEKEKEILLGLRQKKAEEKRQLKERKRLDGKRIEFEEKQKKLMRGKRKGIKKVKMKKMPELEKDTLRESVDVESEKGKILEVKENKIEEKKRLKEEKKLENYKEKQEEEIIRGQEKRMKKLKKEENKIRKRRRYRKLLDDVVDLLAPSGDGNKKEKKAERIIKKSKRKKRAGVGV